MTNDFSNLDAQSEVSAFAQFSPLEHAEAQAYFAEMETKQGEREAVFSLSPEFKAVWLAGN